MMFMPLSRSLPKEYPVGYELPKPTLHFSNSIHDRLGVPTRPGGVCSWAGIAVHSGRRAIMPCCKVSVNLKNLGAEEKNVR